MRNIIVPLSTAASMVALSLLCNNSALAIKLNAAATDCSTDCESDCVNDTSGYLYSSALDEQANLEDQYDAQAEALLIQDEAQVAQQNAYEAQQAASEATEIQYQQQLAYAAQIEALQVQEEVYDEMTIVADQALQESIRLQNEAYELQGQAIEAQSLVQTSDDCSSDCSTDEDCTSDCSNSDEGCTSSCSSSCGSTTIVVDDELVANTTKTLSDVAQDYQNQTAQLVADSLNDDVHIYAMPDPHTTFLYSYEAMCDQLETLEDVTLISQCNEIDYFEENITNNYKSALAGDLSLQDFQESTQAIIKPVYNQYEAYFMGLDDRATISGCRLAEDQMYKTVEASQNLLVSGTSY